MKYKLMISMVMLLFLGTKAPAQSLLSGQRGYKTSVPLSFNYKQFTRKKKLHGRPLPIQEGIKAAGRHLVASMQHQLNGVPPGLAIPQPLHRKRKHIHFAAIGSHEKPFGYKNIDWGVDGDPGMSIELSDQASFNIDLGYDATLDKGMKQDMVQLEAPAGQNHELDISIGLSFDL